MLRATISAPCVCYVSKWTHIGVRPLLARDWTQRIGSPGGCPACWRPSRADVGPLVTTDGSPQRLACLVTWRGSLIGVQPNVLVCGHCVHVDTSVGGQHQCASLGHENRRRRLGGEFYPLHADLDRGDPRARGAYVRLIGSFPPPMIQLIELAMVFCLVLVCLLDYSGNCPSDWGKLPT